MKVRTLMTFAILLPLCACSSKSSAPAAVGAAQSSNPSAPADKPKVYSVDDVNQELNQGGVQNGASQADVQAFFKANPRYQVCQDNDGGLIAVIRNKQADPTADDQYIVIAYRQGVVASRDIGPPQFSVGNVASYCH